MDAQLRKARTLDAIVRLFLKEFERRPLILMIEDLHWLDDESQALLDLLADATANAKLLMLVNYRPEYAHRWTDKSWCQFVRLDTPAATMPGRCCPPLWATIPTSRRSSS